MNCLQFLNT